MIQNFDYYRQSEKPEFILCNPDDTQICVLTISDTRCILRYNDTSELSFQVTEGCTDGYDLLETNREVLVDGLGYFIIDTVSEDDTDGEHHGAKTVNAKSAQYELAHKIVDYVSDVLPFYDSTHTSGKVSFMEHMLTLMPGWSFTCDSVLDLKYRSIEITKQTVLDALYSTASKAYQCIFTFDFLNRVVRADSVETLTSSDSPIQKTDIYLSFDNIIEQVDLRESADNIKTKLYVYGQDLDIRQVNPLGTAYIVNVDYFKNLNWMEQDLIDAVDAWEAKVDGYQDDYAAKLTELSELRAQLTEMQTDLVTLEGKKAEVDNVISAKIEGNLTTGDNETEYKQLVEESNVKAAEIKAKQNEIDAKQKDIESLLSQLKTINTDCSPENEVNFTADQYRRLSRFLKEGEYANNNYVVTDLTTPQEEQGYAQELYDEGQIVLARLSQPAFTLSVDAKGFIHMPEFLAFTQQLELGCMVTLEKNEDLFYYPILLEMEFSWDDKEDFSLSFGNRFHLDDAGYTFEELLGAANNTSSSVSASWDSIVDFNRNYKSQVADLINNAFNVALHTIISSANQDIVWDASGLTCRKWNAEGGVYDNEQFKIINNMIAFTDDGWNSLKTVIGKIVLDSGDTKYGIVAEAIVGKLLAGENLVISNEAGTFRVDGDGVYFGSQKKDENGDPVYDENGDPIMDYEDLRDYIAEQVGGIDVSDLAGAISSYYGAEEPYGAVSDVAVGSDTYKELITKEGDLWQNSDTGKVYRYTCTFDEASNTYSFDWVEFAGVPQDIFDKYDGKRTIYTEVPVNGFQKNDLWIFNSEDSELTVNGGSCDAPSGAQNNDLLVATADSDTYDASAWTQYSPNIDKGNDSFEFHLNDEGMTLKNGTITMSGTRGGYSYGVKLNSTEGFEITRSEEQMFYIDSATGNVVFKGHLSGASGTFSGELQAATGTFKGTFAGTLGIGGSADNPNFSVDEDGNVKITSGEIHLGEYDSSVGKYAFHVDEDGNLYANNGIFSGNVTWEGQTIASDYLDLHGIKIYSKTEKDADGNPLLTFAVDDNGNVTIGGDVTFDTDSFLTWEDIEADEDGVISDAAGDLVKKLAAGEYTDGGTTFINGKNIYSPNIYTDDFSILGRDIMAGETVFHVYYDDDEERLKMILNSQRKAVIGAYNLAISASTLDFSECNVVTFGSTSGTEDKVYFSDTNVFYDGSTVDFSNATIKGLNTAGVVAVFG